MSRYPDWPQILDGCIEAGKSRTFEYGSFDCCLFAADTVLAMTGVDYAAPFRGYASQADAAVILDDHGGLQGLLTHVLGEPVHVSQMGRGDVCLVEGALGLSTGVCTGSMCWVPSPSGLVPVPRDRAVCAWKVA